MNSTKAIEKLQSLQTHPTKVLLGIKDTKTGAKLYVPGWAMELVDTVGCQPAHFTFTIKL